MTFPNELVEPEAAEFSSSVNSQEVLLLSIAVSTKRIADALTDTAQLKEVIRELSLQPVNHYGEGLSEAIQMSIVRGLNKQDY